MKTVRERRRARREHRRAAKELIRNGTLLNYPAPVGSIPWCVARWHLKKARR